MEGGKNWKETEKLIHYDAMYSSLQRPCAIAVRGCPLEILTVLAPVTVFDIVSFTSYSLKF